MNTKNMCDKQKWLRQTMKGGDVEYYCWKGHNKNKGGTTIIICSKH